MCNSQLSFYDHTCTYMQIVKNTKTCCVNLICVHDCYIIGTNQFFTLIIITFLPHTCTHTNVHIGTHANKLYFPVICMAVLMLYIRLAAAVQLTQTQR